MAKNSLLKGLLGGVMSGVGGYFNAKAAQDNAINDIKAKLLTHKIQSDLELAQKKTLAGEEYMNPLDKTKLDTERIKLENLRMMRERFNQQQVQPSQPMQPQPMPSQPGQPMGRPVGVGDIQDSIRGRMQPPPQKIQRYAIGADGSYEIKEDDNPEYKIWMKQQESDVEAEKPLAGESAVRYQASLRGLDAIDEINTKLNRKEYLEEKKDALKKAMVYIDGATAEENWGTAVIPGLKGRYSIDRRNVAGDEGASLGNYFLNLSESILRAESGAAVTKPEEVRTKARTLLSQWSQSPKTWDEISKVNYNFLQGTAKEIRPKRQTEWEREYKSLQGTKNTDINIKPANIPQEIWDSTSKEQRMEYFQAMGAM